MQIKIRYSEEYLKEKFVEHGESLPREETIFLPKSEVEALSQEARKALFDLFGSKLLGENGVSLTHVEEGYGFDKKNSVILYRVAKPVTPEEWNAVILGFQDAKEKVRADLDRRVREKLEKMRLKMHKAREERTEDLSVGVMSAETRSASQELVSEAEALDLERWALQEELKRERTTRHAAEEAQKREEKRRQEEEKMVWVREHGSEHLRGACESGYDCQRLYAGERAEHEYPEYVLDFEENAWWRSRSCPSPEALAEARRVGGKVVWLTAYAVKNRPPENMPDEYYYENPYEEPWKPCEAVVVQNYLEKYDLVREM